MPHSTIGVGSKGGWETLRDQTHVQTVSVPFAAGTSFGVPEGMEAQGEGSAEERLSLVVARAP
eukprot:3095067-Rhodomonas_salina.1